MLFFEERDAAAMLGQSRGTGPIMYLLLERENRRRGCVEQRAEIAMGTGRGNELKEADMEGEDGAMQVRESGT